MKHLALYMVYNVFCRPLSVALFVCESVWVNRRITERFPPRTSMSRFVFILLFVVASFVVLSFLFISSHIFNSVCFFFVLFMCYVYNTHARSRSASVVQCHTRDRTICQYVQSVEMYVFDHTDHLSKLRTKSLELFESKVIFSAILMWFLLVYSIFWPSIEWMRV